MAVSRIEQQLAGNGATRVFRTFAQALKTLFIVGVFLVTMAGVANATEMSSYESGVRLSPLGTAPEEFVAVQPGRDLARQCSSFCLEKQTCVAIYYSDDTPARCYYYNSYGFSLRPVRGYNTTFKIWD